MTDISDDILICQRKSLAPLLAGSVEVETCTICGYPILSVSSDRDVPAACAPCVMHELADHVAVNEGLPTGMISLRAAAEAVLAALTAAIEGRQIAGADPIGPTNVGEL